MTINPQWPGAYIVGAPKCGTTALASYLADHPGVSVSEPKEPGYLATDMPGLSVVRSDAEYRALFDPGERKLKLDASIWYLYSETAVRNIIDRQPDARFIAVLRNPVRMVPSLHRQLVNSLDEDVKDFAKAWRLSPARERGEQVWPRCRAPMTLIYTRVAAFADQIERLIAAAGRDSVLVLFQEEMLRDTGAVYRRALAFLGLEDDGRASFDPVNTAASFRSLGVQKFIKRDSRLLQAVARPIKKALKVQSLGFRAALDRINRSQPANERIAPEIAAEIADTYRADMQRLAGLLGRDLKSEFGWPY